MISSSKGMGSHKHGISGHPSRSPGYKQQRAREANAQAEAERAKKPKPRVYASVREAMEKENRR